MNWIPFLYLTNGTKIISMTVPMSVEMAVPVTTSLWQQLLFTRLCCSNIPIFPSLDHPNASHIDNLCSYVFMIKSWVLAGPFNSVADAICCLPSPQAGIHVHGKKCPRQIDLSPEQPGRQSILSCALQSFIYSTWYILMHLGSQLRF
jgi:hypothetical protein